MPDTDTTSPEATAGIPDAAAGLEAARRASEPRATTSPALPASAMGPTADGVVLELRVRNHPGTMSHVTGLFARRGFNLDAILCVPLADGATSRMLLLVSEEPRLQQVERQLAKLYDVLEVRHRPELDAGWFARLMET